jgi:hypothetical protein
MIEYAWAHPETLVRERAKTDREAMRRAWEELQSCPDWGRRIFIYQQERAGTVGKTSSSLEVPESWPSGWAWARPDNAERCMDATFDAATGKIQAILDEMPDPPESVVVYRQRACLIVTKEDPEPAIPEPEQPELDTPTSLISAVADGTRTDFDVITTLAMLWIAEALQARLT